MLNDRYTRTTITVPEDLLFEIKKKALIEKKTVKEIFIDGLRLILRYKGDLNKNKSPVSLYGAWGKGESGSIFLKKNRNVMADKSRDNYLIKTWKKS